MSPRRNAVSDEVLLHGALRNRSPDVHNLAEFMALSVEETSAALSRLRDRGLLQFDGACITYLNPADVTETVIQEQVAAHAQRIHRDLLAIAELSSQLRGMLIEGAGPSEGESWHRDSVEMFRGPLAGTDALERMLDSERRSGTAQPQVLGMMPDPNPPAMTPEHQQRMWTKAANLEGSLRLILPRPPDALPEEALLKYAHLGVDVRWLSPVPSWLWINTFSGQVAMPLVWGEVFPITVAIVSEPAAVAISVALFDACWAVSVPIRAASTEPLWGPLLRLMRPGLSLNESAGRLGITPRTARRRLEKGMQHYGVDSFFALGAAWSAELEGGRVPYAPRRSITDG
ncbi:MAG: hypothetical protein IR160_01330 [Salinibacterium sp.]|nr:hypothetical protein [Salinibacterium sp.]MBF0671209.1 hypothetical protein [Salinibacterium sp.]